VYIPSQHVEGQLRQIENDEPFVFNVKESDQAYNQAHYEALGEVLIQMLCFSEMYYMYCSQTITEHVYGLLQSDGKLNKTTIPVSALKSCDRCVLSIHITFLHHLF